MALAIWLRTKGDLDQQVLCHVRVGMTVQQEASMFWRAQQQRKNLTPFDEFRARLVARDPAALRITECLEKLDMSMPYNQRSNWGGMVFCVREIMRLDEHRGIDFVYDVLNVCKQAYPDTVIRRNLVLAVAVLLDKYEDLIDRQRLVETLAKTNQPALEKEAHMWKKHMPWGLYAYMATLLISAYNQRLGQDKRLAATSVSSLSAQLGSKKKG